MINLTSPLVGPTGYTSVKIALRCVLYSTLGIIALMTIPSAKEVHTQSAPAYSLGDLYDSHDWYVDEISTYEPIANYATQLTLAMEGGVHVPWPYQAMDYTWDDAGDYEGESCIGCCDLPVVELTWGGSADDDPDSNAPDPSFRASEVVIDEDLAKTENGETLNLTVQWISDADGRSTGPSKLTSER